MGEVVLDDGASPLPSLSYRSSSLSSLPSGSPFTAGGVVVVGGEGVVVLVGSGVLTAVVVVDDVSSSHFQCLILEPRTEHTMIQVTFVLLTMMSWLSCHRWILFILTASLQCESTGTKIIVHQGCDEIYKTIYFNFSDHKRLKDFKKCFITVKEKFYSLSSIKLSQNLLRQKIPWGCCVIGPGVSFGQTLSGEN